MVESNLMIILLNWCKLLIQKIETCQNNGDLSGKIEVKYTRMKVINRAIHYNQDLIQELYQAKENLIAEKQ